METDELILSELVTVINKVSFEGQTAIASDPFAKKPFRY
jgi:hypothetical protein